MIGPIRHLAFVATLSLNATLVASLVAILFATPASAQVTYQNDGFVDNTAVGFQGGFAVGEIAASCFSPPESHYPMRLSAIAFLYGGDLPGATIVIGVKVWGGGGNGEPPSELLHTAEDIEAISATDSFNEYDLTSQAITVTAPFCVGIEIRDAGLPSLARDDDGTINQGNNWLYTDLGGSFSWFQSSDLGLTGDWVIRAKGRPAATGGDTGVPDTGTPDTGTPDTGTPDTGTPDTGVTPDAAPGIADPVIFAVDQDGESLDEDIEVTIIGQDFSEAYTYLVDGERLEGVEVLGGTEVIGLLEAGTDLEPDEYDLEIRGDFPSRRVTERDAITIEFGAPSLLSVSPSVAVAGEDIAITVSGTNFQAPLTLQVGSATIANVLVISPTLAQVTIPGSTLPAPGVYDIVAITGAGNSAPLTRAFTVNAAPSGGGGGCVAASAAGGFWWIAGLVFLCRRRRIRR
ncbi:MAG: hypothetical protein ACI81R_001039 [Bradymonadia bacterium]|jgi:hypothetical protein